MKVEPRSFPFPVRRHVIAYSLPRKVFSPRVSLKMPLRHLVSYQLRLGIIGGKAMSVKEFEIDLIISKSCVENLL